MWQTWNSVCWFVVCLWGQAQHKHTSLRLAVAANLPISSRRHTKPRCGFASRPDVKFSFCVTASQSQNGLYSCHNRRISDLSKPKCFKWIPAWRCTVCGDCSVLFCWICGQKILFLAFQLFVQWLHGFPTGDGRVAGGGWKATKEKMLRSLRRLTERTDKARDCYPSYSHLITLYVANWGVLCVTAGVLCALGRSGLNRHKRELALFFVPSIYRAYKSVFFFLREDLANAACMLNPPHPLFLAPSYPSPRWFLLARQRSYSSPCSRAKGHKVRLFACVGFFFSGTE